MAAFDHDFDYLQLLGIDPAEASRAGPALTAAIKARRKEWTAQSLNPLYQQQARSQLERAREFEAYLKDPAALAAYLDHVKRSRLARRAGQKETLALWVAEACERRNALTVPQCDLLARQAGAEGFPADLLEEVLKERKIAVHAPRTQAKAASPKLPVRSPALDGVILAEIQGWLKVLGLRSLYEAIDLPESAPPSTLIAEAKRRQAYWSRKLPKTNLTTAWERTLQSCQTYLKDDESKKKYDCALFNQKIGRYVARIDLVLAGVEFEAGDRARLLRVGVEDFGFSLGLAEVCVDARIHEKGVATAGPEVTVSIEVGGQVRCRRCGAWNSPERNHCRECRGSMQRKCENPSCRAEPMSVDCRTCPQCGLRVSFGVQFRTLLQLADAFLSAGDYQSADTALRVASQYHPGSAIDERSAKSARIRQLSAVARAQMAARALTAAMATLAELSKLAPRAILQGVPPIEKIATAMTEVTGVVRATRVEADPVDAAKTLLACLRRWSDCDEAFEKLRAACHRLESDRGPKAASQLLGKLRELRPEDPEIRNLAVRLEPKVQLAEEQETERHDSMVGYVAALRENRLYAAEKALHAIELSTASGPAPPAAAKVRRLLAEVRADLEEVRRGDGPAASAVQIEQYLGILRRARDCREALSALMALPLDPPGSPRDLNLRREGSRRLLSWAPGTGRRPTGYRVERAIVRPGLRGQESAPQVIHEGESAHFVDPEVVLGGSILRYTVQAVARGRIEVDGDPIRPYDLASAPAPFTPLLISGEVLNLRSARREEALELSWFTPPGVRQVLIERRPGGLDEPDDEAQPLLPTSEGLLIDDQLTPGDVYTYRVSCVFDGPDGEVRTPGVRLVDGLPLAAVLAETSRMGDDPR